MLLAVFGMVRSLSFEELPANIIKMEYAVRGEIDLLAQELREKLKQEDHGLPFSEIVPCNIGNPQALGQKPMSYHRQLLSLLTNPELRDQALYAADVHERARQFANATTFGAYTHSKGAMPLREKVAEFIQRRDGQDLAPVDPDSIYLTDGASAAVKLSLAMLVSSLDDGVLIPIPQYPLYTAALTNLGGTAVGYYLDEEAGWSVSMDEVEAAMSRFKADRPSGRVKAMVVINPGNPTGNVMTRAQMEVVVKFCQKHGIILLADEVYQENIWNPAKTWESFRKVTIELGLPVEVISYHSISKGYYSECGLRGGYMQLHNIDNKVQEQMYKLSSITLCANTLGQAMVASIMNPPVKGEASFDTFHAERTAVLESLRRKSLILTQRLNKLPGMFCQPSDGAMYAFPRLSLPAGAIKAAAVAGKPADTFYCIELLKATGIVVVPGSGFRQKPGTWHFRITILPPEDKLSALLDRLEEFHRGFLERFSKPEL